VRQLFETWEKNAALYPYSDQSSFAKSVVECGVNPAILPPNFNYRGFGMGPNPFYGPIKVWHWREEVPHNLAEWNKKRPYAFGQISRIAGRLTVHPNGSPPVYVKEELMECAGRMWRVLRSWLRSKLHRCSIRLKDETCLTDEG
jgi:hypothetical protein